jgi:multicomponent Na+:H+ antiporter subunit E
MSEHSRPVSGPGASRRRAVVERAAIYLALWFVLLPSTKPGDVVLGLAAAAAATWISLRLLPPEGGRVRLGALMLQGPHFLWESVRAGVDVARRALAPRMTLEPGFVTSPTRLPRGVARNTFSTVAGLMPGTLPAGEDGESLVVHALDVSQPVAKQLGAEEQRFGPALSARSHHD